MAEIDQIRAYQERALEDIKAAEQLLGSQFDLAAISRAYYAVFYAITAALLANGTETRSHKQLGIQFRKQFIKTKKVAQKYSALLEELFQARQVADYDAIPEMDEAEVRHLVNVAREFVTLMNQL